MKIRFTLPLLISAASMNGAFAQDFQLGSQDVGTGASGDGWLSNMVIREEVVFVNNTGEDQTVVGTSFECGIRSNRSSLTPFIVQINDTNLNGDFTDDNDFKVLSIGNTRISGVDYDATGVTSFAFSEVPATFVVPAGAAIGAAFMDSSPDGTGGEAGSVVSYDNGATVGSMWYAGNSGTTHPNPIAIDTLLSGPPAAGVENRNYHFSITVTLQGIDDLDGDGIPSSIEAMFDFLSDNDPDDAAEDEDMDFSSNFNELQKGTDLENPDTDGDDLLDGHESASGTWVSATETGTNPRIADSDGDGLLDGVETNDDIFVDLDQTGTDPNLEDSDGDGWGELEELNVGTDMNDPASVPAFPIMGAPEILPSGGVVDGWNSNLIINEAASYLNDTGSTQIIQPKIFRCRIGNVRSRVTPFLVRMSDTNGNMDIFDDNDFTVMAIGTTRVAGTDYTVTGRSAFVFDDAGGEFALEPGERIAAAFIDADPDGTNGAEGSVITYVGGATAGEMWYNGASGEPHPEPAVPLAVGGTLSGETAASVDNRTYFFQVLFETAAGSGGLRFTDVSYTNGEVNLTWESKPGRIYAIEYSGDLRTSWAEQSDDWNSAGDLTSFTFPAGNDPQFPDLSTYERLYFRVRDITPPPTPAQ